MLTLNGGTCEVEGCQVCALQDEKILHTADRTILRSLQLQLERAEAAAKQVANQAILASPVTNLALPLMSQVG